MLIGIFNIMGALRVGYNKQFNIMMSHIISILFVNVIAYLQLSLIHRAFLHVLNIAVLSVFQIAVSVVWTLIVFKLDKKYIPVKEMILVYGDKKAEDLSVKTATVYAKLCSTAALHILMKAILTMSKSV